MKHPRLEVLQDYFENVLKPLDENRVKEHLLQCDQCTKILSDFTVIETKLLNNSAVEISEQTKSKIFTDARSILTARKQKIALQEEKRQKLELLVSEWKETIFPQLRIPALQFGSLSVVLMVIIAVEKGPGEEYIEPIITDEVGVLTYKGFVQRTED